MWEGYGPAIRDKQKKFQSRSQEKNVRNMPGTNSKEISLETEKQIIRGG
jgi:hypothetical protein